MNTDLDALLRRAISRELERHCTDAELEAHAAQRLANKPLVQAWVEDHLQDCVDCRARVPRPLDSQPRPLAAAKHWDQLGDMLRRTTAIECVLEPGALRMRGAEPYRPNDVTLSKAALEAQGEVELPNGVHVVVQVALCDPARPLYEIRVWSKDPIAQGQMALTEAHAAREGETTSAGPHYLDLERVIIRGKLGYAAAVRVGPGVRSLGISFSPSSPWYVIPLSLGPAANVAKAY